MNAGVETKTCAKCGVTKPVESFSRYRQGWLNHACKPCKAQVSKEWRTKNPERAREQNKHHYQRRYYGMPEERARKIQAGREWKAKHPEKHREISIASQRRRAARKRTARLVFQMLAATKELTK